jgi:hypothetical protein
MLRQSDRSRQVRRDAAVARPELRAGGSTFMDAATNPPPGDRQLSVRARDTTGEYSLPFPVTCRDGLWCHAEHGNALAVEIVKWRIWT